MTQTETATGTTDLRVLTIEPGTIDAHRDLLGDMYRQRVAGAIIKGVFEPDHMAELSRRLVAGVEGMPRAVAPTFKGGLYGTPLVMGSEDLRGYLEDAERFRTAIAGLFESVGGLETRI
jgi:hypothetical protein